MILVDRTPHSLFAHVIRTRAPEEVDLVVLHQTGAPPGLAAERVDRIKAHAVVMDSGAVLQLHPWLARLRYGSGAWNSRCISVEHRANLPGRYDAHGAPRWAGKVVRETWDADERRAQVLASRALLRALRDELPALRYVAAHRQIASPSRAGCPGPDLWREVGEWAVDALGLELVATEPTGADLPPNWRLPPTIAPDAPCATVGGRPAATSSPTPEGPATLPLPA